MEITTLQEFQAASSLISTRMNEIKAQLKCDKSKARRLAAVEVGKTYSPPLSADEFETMLARALGHFYGEKRNAAIKAHWAEKNATKKAPTADGKPSSLVDLYRKWCAINKHVASDAEIAFFTGRAPQTVAWARGELEKAGFKFSKNGAGWNVEALPEAPKYTEAQWQEREKRLKDIERLLGELRIAS